MVLWTYSSKKMSFSVLLLRLGLVVFCRVSRVGLVLVIEFA